MSTLSSAILEWVDTIKILPLTIHGKVLLSGFPKEAIENTTERYKKAKYIRNPFGWFFEMTLRYCKWHDIAINWTLVEQLKIKSNYTEKKPLLKEPVTTKKPFQKKEKKLAMYIAWQEKEKVAVDYKAEMQQRKRAKQSSGWKWLESFIGKAFNPPIPEFIHKKN